MNRSEDVPYIVAVRKKKKWKKGREVGLCVQLENLIYNQSKLLLGYSLRNTKWLLREKTYFKVYLKRAKCAEVC